MPARPSPRIVDPSLAGPAMLAGLAHTRRRARPGEVLHRAGSPLQSVYPIESGLFKSSVGLDDGRVQVTGFHMAGDVLGLDALGGEVHTSDATALEASVVCVVACSRLEEPGVQRYLCRALSRELANNRRIMLLLGTLRAEERLAAFLLDFSRRLASADGAASSRDFHLHMSRAEIASFLGLTLETVSRLFTRLAAGGLVAVARRHILILDVPGLQALTSGQPRAPLGIFLGAS